MAEPKVVKDLAHIIFEHYKLEGMGIKKLLTPIMIKLEYICEVTLFQIIYSVFDLSGPFMLRSKPNNCNCFG